MACHTLIKKVNPRPLEWYRESVIRERFNPRFAPVDCTVPDFLAALGVHIAVVVVAAVVMAAVALYAEDTTPWHHWEAAHRKEAREHHRREEVGVKTLPCLAEERANRVDRLDKQKRDAADDDVVGGFVVVLLKFERGGKGVGAVVVAGEVGPVGAGVVGEAGADFVAIVAVVDEDFALDT